MCVCVCAQRWESPACINETVEILVNCLQTEYWTGKYVMDVGLKIARANIFHQISIERFHLIWAVVFGFHRVRIGRYHIYTFGLLFVFSSFNRCMNNGYPSQAWNQIIKQKTKRNENTFIYLSTRMQWNGLQIHSHTNTQTRKHWHSKIESEREREREWLWFLLLTIISQVVCSYVTSTLPTTLCG